MISLAVAAACAGLFAGAAIYVTAVEHPARMAEGPEPAVREFGTSYNRGKLMQIGLSVIGGGAGLAAFRAARDPWLLTGGLLLLALIPYTLIFILSTSRALLDPKLDSSSSRATALLTRWGRRHLVRTAVGSAAFLIFLWRMTSG